MARILIIEDDLEISGLLSEFLLENGYQTYCLYNGLHVPEVLQEYRPDLVLLDLMLPYRSGDQVLTDIRAGWAVPVIIISAKGTTRNKIDLLRSGADDYVTKPFDLEELGARVAAHLRRETRIKKQNVLRFFGEMSIDYSGHQLQIGETPIVLSRTEFAIVELLSLNAGQVFDRERIYESVWGLEGAGSSDTVMEHIRKIRAKLSAYTDHNYIETVWGIGYKWNG